MDRKRRRMTEGMLYVFSLPRGADKATVTDAIENVFERAKCARALGSGTSLADDGTIAVEIGAYDRDKAGDVLSRVCNKLKCDDYELVWD